MDKVVTMRTLGWVVLGLGFLWMLSWIVCSIGADVDRQRAEACEVYGKFFADGKLTAAETLDYKRRCEWRTR